jgi:large subunit ribosomal protein L6
MSRVGKYPVEIPSGVQVTLEGRTLTVKGKLGQLSIVISEHVEVKIEGNQVVVEPSGEDRSGRMMWGTTRALIASMVEGVSKGYQKILEINGTGFRAAVQGAVLVLNLGYSHDVNYAVPEGIKVTVPRPTAVIIEGIDKRQVGQVAAEIRGYRPPEPYKGKGVKYEGEQILRKEGKKK